jgi:hypothetical protein
MNADPPTPEAKNPAAEDTITPEQREAALAQLHAEPENDQPDWRHAPAKRKGSRTKSKRSRPKRKVYG